MKSDQFTIKRLMNYFFRGLLLFAPLAATLYVILLVIRKIDGIARFGIRIPGLGIVIALAFITLLGYVATTLFVKSAFGFTEGIIKKVPLIHLLYSSLKDFTSAIVNSKPKFNKPVMVCIDSTMQIYRIGFITKESLEVLGMPQHIAVYLPNSYSFSGKLMLVPPTLVIPLALPSSEVIKFNFSGGVTPIKKKEADIDNTATDKKI